MPSFVYPYNFIRPGTPSRRAPAPSHATFSGLSGTIRCELTTLTPIFTPDPETNTSGAAGDGHRVLTFFKHGNQYMIPGTSLKGMVRSVAETLSNSCWSQFDGGWVHPWRPTPTKWKDSIGLTRCPGRVVRDGDGKLCVRHMTEVWVRLAAATPFGDGDPVTVTVAVQQHARRHFPYLLATSVTPGHVSGPDTRHGYIKIVPREASERHYQRVFVDWYDALHDGAPQHPDLPITDAVQELWRNARWGPAPEDKFPRLLREGDLVWYTVKGNGSNAEIESIGPVALYKRHHNSTRSAALRSLARQQVRALLPGLDNAQLRNLVSLLEPCGSAEELCFCCRVFGLVRGDKAANGDDDNALAGRVSFGCAVTTATPAVGPLPLRILGEPQPKFAPFYLAADDDNARSWDDSSPAPPLRGRKFYWHHPDKSTSPSYYRQPNSTKLAPEGRSKFNATVTAIGSGARFTFDVDFWDLSEAELGCLLLSLTLWGNLRHKFGMGKPIGFGSCQITIESLSIIRDRRHRYRAANLLSAADRAAAGPDEFVDAFRTHMVQEATRLGAPPATTFAQLPQIKDAAIMWNYPAPTALDIRYNPDPDGQYRDCGYAYFTDHGGPALRTLDETAAGNGQPD